MNEIPLVSISCVTFNHAPYLRECLEGFLMQQCDFKFEILIHDDASTDGTRAIIEEYTQKHPGIFFPMYQKENQYSQGVRGMMAKFNFPRCRGKYIALCEGDDYWIDPLKLQKQVDFLEGNPDFVLCYTNGMRVNEKKVVLKHELIINIDQTEFTHLDMPLYAPTLTRLFLKSSIENMPTIPLFENYVGGDLFMLIWQSKYGKIKFINDITSSYRMHEEGVWSSKSKLKKIEGLIATRIICLNIIDNNKLKVKFYKIILNLISNLKIHHQYRSSIFIDFFLKTIQNQKSKLSKYQMLLIYWVVFLLKLPLKKFRFIKFIKFFINKI